jgi:DNA-binding transcriptional regulator YdaS (Cro superfamily)
MDLKTYVATESGSADRLAEALDVPVALIFAWADGAAPVPEDRAPELEVATDFKVLAESLCPAARWHRVRDKDWTKGKPLLVSAPIDLKTYVEIERGVAARLAEMLQVPPPLISQWAGGTRPVPEDRAPSIEFATEFRVPVERLCPETRWHRVPDRAWPNGKPLIDKTPAKALPALLTRARDAVRAARRKPA